MNNKIYNIEFDKFIRNFVPWFLRTSGFNFKDGDFQLGYTDEQEVFFALKASYGNFYYEPTKGIGLQRKIESNFNRIKIQKEVKKQLEDIGFIVNEINIIQNTEDPESIFLNIKADNNISGILLNDAGGELLEFLNSLFTSIQDLNNRFYAYITEALYLNQFNSQKIYLTRLLNDKFDPVERRIYIVNIANNSLTPFFGRYLEIDTPYVGRYSEAGDSDIYLARYNEVAVDYQFIVQVDSSIIFNENIMRGYIDKYLFVGKNYIINTI